MKNTLVKKIILKSFIAISALITLIMAIVLWQPVQVKATSIEIYDPPSPYNYISEANYAESMAEVETKLEKIRQSGYFTGKNNLQIYYEKYLVSNAKAGVVISHGLGENITKYREVIYYLINQGYSVFGIDHRGHGRSGRLGIDETQISIEKFDYYVEDFKTFMDQIVLKESTTNLLYTHSMGGAIGALFLERYSNYFQAAILSTPMMDINTGKYPELAIKAIANLNSLSSLKNDYLPGCGPYSGKPDFENSPTQSKARYDYYFNQTLAKSELQNGGATYLWIKEAFDAMDELTQAGNAAKVEIPVLIFQAELDTVVEAKGYDKFASAAKNCQKMFVPGAKHEIYRETDRVISSYFDQVFKFFADNLK